MLHLSTALHSHDGIIIGSLNPNHATAECGRAKDNLISFTLGLSGSEEQLVPFPSDDLCNAIRE